MAGSGSYLLQQTRALGMTRQLGQAIGLLKLSNCQLAAFLGFHEAVNPHLVLQASEHPVGSKGDEKAPGSSEAGAGDAIENLAASGPGLEEHALREIGYILTSAHERAIASFFVEALEPTGWLGRSVAEVAADAGCSLAEAEAILIRIQRISPSGMFARDLAECLRIQAEEAGVLSDTLRQMLEHLPMLARGEFDQLARLCGCSRRKIMDHFETIRSFNPKPGTGINAETVPQVPPDLVVTDDGARLEVTLNRSVLPTIAVSAAEGVSEADRGMLEAARSLARAVERRNITTLEIAADLVRRQSEFLRKGPSHLKPLSLREVSEALGLSESTVSRVTSCLRMDAPRGPVALKDFFSGALPGRDGAVSTAAVRERISDLIRTEDPARPLSDAAITEYLATMGIRVARRTVAKYREVLRIPGSSERRARVTRGRR